MAKEPSKGRKASKDSVDSAETATEASESVSGPEPLVDTIPPEVHETSQAENPADAVVLTPPMPDPSDEPQVAAAPEPQSSPQPAPPQATASGFLPLLLGGLIAGVIGFGVATLTAPATDDSLSVQLAQQSAAIDALEAQMAQPSTVDTSALEADFAAQIDAISASLDDLSARISALEDRPVGTVSQDSETGAAVAADIDALRAQLSEMADAAQTELAEARAAAAAIEENAAAAARNAAARAALARVQTALESGSPIGAALGDLEEATGNSAPPELLAVEDGVPTLPALQDSYPDVAREALAAARREGVAGEQTTGIGAFIRNQFDVRSTAPRDGDDADAILSRAEAALRAGRLSDALAELSALPEVARAEMSGWLAEAEARADAVAAVDVLSSSLSDN